ncbi:MAG: DNA repair protein RecO [Gemmatimonadaceae bacterium]
MNLVTTDALVLHAFDYLETSRIVRLATRDAGMLSVIARGARASDKRFGWGLDLFASGVAQIHSKPGRDLQQLAGFDVGSARGALSAHLERFSAASALSELALRFAGGDEPGEFFDVLTSAFDAIAAAPPARARDVGLAAAWRLVAALGFAPAVQRCCSCHEDIASEATMSFSHQAGGVVCAPCAAGLPRGRSLPPDARAALNAWSRGEDVDLREEGVRRAHLRLLREFLEQHLNDGRPMRAFESWERGMGGARQA